MAINKQILAGLLFLLSAVPVSAREINSVEEALRLGDLSLMEGRFQKSEQYYNRSIELDPKRPAPLIRLGILSYEQSQYAKAKDYFAQAGGLVKDKPTQRSLDVLLQKISQASVVLQEIENQKGDASKERLLHLHKQAAGVMSQEPFIMALAAPHLRVLLAANPNDPELLKTLADGYFLSSDSSQAFFYYKKLSQVVQPEFNLLMRYATVAIAMGAYDEARMATKKALRQAVAMKNPSAIQECLAVIKKLPVFSAQIDVFIQSKEYSKAFKELRKYLSHQASLPWAAVQMGRLYEEMGRVSQAEKLYRQALDWRFEDPAAHYELGRFYLHQKKDFEKALQEFVLFRELLYESSDLAWDESVKKKMQQNKLEATRAIYYIKLDILGRPRAAVDEIEWLKKTGQAEAKDYLTLGVAYSRLHKWTSAYQSLKKAIDLDPKSETAKDAEALIESIRSESKKGFQLEA